MITHRRAARPSGRRPRTAGVLGAVVVAAVVAGCSDGLAVSLSDPQTVTPAGTAATSAPDPGGAAADPQTSGAATGQQAEDPGTTSAGPAAEPTSRRPVKRWGGGTRVGTFRTRGTVVGDDGTGEQTRVAVGTCDLAHDVRTVTVTLDADAVLVIDVTGPNVGSLELTVPGDPVRSVEYVGDVTPVITLTPTRTEVKGALLVPPAGSDAAPIRVDASFDC